MTGCPSHSRPLPTPPHQSPRASTNQSCTAYQYVRLTNLKDHEPPALSHPSKLMDTRLSRAPKAKHPGPSSHPSSTPPACLVSLPLPLLGSLPRPQGPGSHTARKPRCLRAAECAARPRAAGLPAATQHPQSNGLARRSWGLEAGASVDLPPGVPDASLSPPAPASFSRAPPAPAGCPGSAAALPCCASPCWAEAGSSGARLWGRSLRAAARQGAPGPHCACARCFRRRRLCGALGPRSRARAVAGGPRWWGFARFGTARISALRETLTFTGTAHSSCPNHTPPKSSQ